MKEKFLVKESKRIHKATRRRLRICTLLFVCFMVLLYVLLQDEFARNPSFKNTIYSIGIVLIVIVVCADVIGTIRTRKADAQGENLILPYQDGSKQEIAEKINQDAANGLLFEEYIYEFPEGKKPYGEKIVLTSSYLLLCSTKITVIPRDKIYWTCAQVGYKGGPYRVRFLVFTVKKVFEVIGVDIEHVEALANQLYEYLPNIFAGYDDDFNFSYQLEELYTKDHYEFMRLYEAMQQRYKTQEKDAV